MTIASNLSFIQNTAGAITTSTVNATALPFVFSAASTEYARIDTTGSLNINTATVFVAGSKLNVNGGGFFNGVVTATTFVGAFTGALTGIATTASQVNTVLQTTNASYFPIFVDANNASSTGELVYTTSSFSINPSNGAVNIGGNLTAPFLAASGGATLNQQLYVDMNGTASAEAIALRGGNGASGGVYIKFSTATQVTSYFGQDRGIIGTTGDLTAYSTAGVGFRVHTGGNATPRLVITANGGVAFGGATNFGTAGQVLQSNGDAAPTWVPVSAGSATTASQVNTVLQITNASYFPTFVDANNASSTGELLYTTSSFSINPGTGIVSISSRVSSISTSTGALQVSGGVGIGENLFVGGTATGGSIRQTSSATPPTSPSPVVGDQWYNTSTDAIYRYTSDGTNSYWLEFAGPSVSSTVSSTVVVLKNSVINVSSSTVAALKTLKATFGNGYIWVSSNTLTNITVVGTAYNTVYDNASNPRIISQTLTPSGFSIAAPGLSGIALVGTFSTAYISDITYGVMYRVTGMLIGATATNNSCVIEQIG